MKRSLLHLFCVAMAAIAFSVAYAVIDTAAAAWRTSRDFVVRLAMAPIAMCSARAGVVARQPRIVLIAARSFFARCVRRAQPRVEAGWRLCSSA
jgi:archaellum biogenesis protein FlaJ (TadC family)